LHTADAVNYFGNQFTLDRHVFDADKSLTQSLQERCDRARCQIQELYSTWLAEMNGFLDAQYELVRLTFWTTHSDEFSGRGPAQTIIYSALHKNVFLFFSAIELAERGLYGPAATLLRPILESLTCAKYCALAEDPSVLETWRRGDDVSLTNHVLNRIDHPSVGELRFLWAELNKMTHASIYAQQLTADFDEIKKEVHSVLSVARLLLAFNYHVLSRYFLTAKAIYYTRTFSDKAAFDVARQNARSVALTFRQSFAKDGKRFLKECCASWRLKPTKGGHRGDLSSTLNCNDS
jgi:hypothetical protein